MVFSKTPQNMVQTFENNNITFIYILCLSVWVVVCLFVSTKRQNGPTFCVGPHMTPGKIWMIKTKKLASNKIQFLLNIQNSQHFLIESVNFFLLMFYNIYKEKMFTTAIEDGHQPSLLKYAKKIPAVVNEYIITMKTTFN